MGNHPGSPPKQHNAVDRRVVHVEIHNGNPSFLAFGDGSIRIFTSEEFHNLDPRLLLGLTPINYLDTMPLLATCEEFNAALKAKMKEYEGGEFLVRYDVARKLFPKHFRATPEPEATDEEADE